MWNKDLMQELGDKRALLETMRDLLDIADSIPDEVYSEIFFISQEECAIDRIDAIITILEQDISRLENVKLEDYNNNTPIGGRWTRG